MDIVEIILMIGEKFELRKYRRKNCVGNWVQKSVYGLRREKTVLSLRDVEGFNSDKLAVIAKCCPYVSFLDASSCYQLVGDDWRVIGEASWMSSLRILNLTFCSITDGDLTRLFRNRNHISTLTLSYTAIGDIGIKRVAMNCPDLEVLKLNGCQNITDISLSILAKYCTKLRHLELSECSKITDVGVQLISQECTLLDYLDLKDCAVTEEIVHYLCYYSKKLEHLNIGNTQISGSAVNAIVPLLPNLKYLNFCGLSINDETVDIIMRCLPGIKKIDFSFCYLLSEEKVKFLCSANTGAEVLTFGLNFS